MGSSRPPALEEFGRQLAELGWVSEVLVAGSLATGDYVPGVSDLDLVALVSGPVDQARHRTLTNLHRAFDRGPGSGLDLGCVYVDSARISQLAYRHPTWTHGQLFDRIVSGVTRAELVRHGYAVFGRPPRDVLPPMSDDDIRAAARAELTGWWAWAASRPWLWLNPGIADLGLTSMARGRYALEHGELLTKTEAIERAAVPGWLGDQLRARRRGEQVRSPRVRTALIAWRDARRTVSGVKRQSD